jgi:DUF4097 and DUF4098 domain-containing protein YvlB
MENSTEIERTFEVGEGCSVDIRNISGTTVIESWDRPEVSIQARKRAKSEQAAEATIIDIGQEGDTVYAKTKTRSDGDWLEWLNNKMRGTAKVDYLVRVPRPCDIATSMVSGKTTVSGTQGQLRLNTVSGDAVVTDVTGSISLNSVSGDIEASELAGDVKLNTVSGDLVIKSSELESLKGNTVSGDVRAETPIAGKMGLTSVSGDMRLTVPEGTACSAKLATLSGDIRTNLPYEAVEDRRTVKHYEINGGGPSLDMSSVSGDLRITTGKEGAASAPRPVKIAEKAAEPVEPEPVAAASEMADPGPSRLDVLKAIESGEISVQDGLAKLQDQKLDE